MNDLISETTAIDLLKKECLKSGGPTAFASEIGVTVSFVSQMLHGHVPITGKVAARLGIAIHREVTIKYESTNNEG